MTTFRIYLWTRNHRAGNNNMPLHYWYPLFDYKTRAEAEEVVATFPTDTKYKIEKINY